jgi:hypothetical protein
VAQKKRFAQMDGLKGIRLFWRWIEEKVRYLPAPEVFGGRVFYPYLVPAGTMGCTKICASVAQKKRFAQMDGLKGIRAFLAVD